VLLLFTSSVVLYGAVRRAPPSLAPKCVQNIASPLLRRLASHCIGSGHSLAMHLSIGADADNANRKSKQKKTLKIRKSSRLVVEVN